MRQFMQHNRPEKKNRGDYRYRPDHVPAPLRISRLKLAGQRECDQQRDQQPTVMQANLNTGNAEKLDLCFHVKALALFSKKSPAPKLPPPEMIKKRARTSPSIAQRSSQTRRELLASRRS